MDETIPPTPGTPKFTEEGQKFVSVKGIRGIITAPTIKKIVLSELLYGKPNRGSRHENTTKIYK